MCTLVTEVRSLYGGQCTLKRKVGRGREHGILPPRYYGTLAWVEHPGYFWFSYFT